jgi:hypothetical protein
VPAPSIIVLMYRETEWPGHLQLQPVHAILGPLHPGEEVTPPIPNPQHSTFNQHVRATFVHLPNANDRVLQARDPIHTYQDLELAVAHREDDGAVAKDVDDGAVFELDGTLHRPFKLGEHVAATCHVVHHTRVEVPALEVIVVAAARAEERLSLGLVQVNLLLLLQCRIDDLRWCRLDGVMTLLHHGHQERRFIVILGLGQIYPLLTWLAATSGPMAGAPAVITLVVTLHSLLLVVASLARASALLTATGRTLTSIATLTHLLLPLLHREKQLAVYARWW